MATKKMGRPTDAPKDFMLRVRMDQEILAKLDKCCEQLGLSRSEVARKSIEEQYERLNKN